MSTPEQIRAAAERIREFLDDHGHLFDDDACEALEVLLAEHPSDDTDQITDERLGAIGFVEDDDESEWFHLFRIGPLWVDRSDVEGIKANYWTVSDESDVCVPIPAPANMGRLKQLCGLLGITLKEPTECAHPTSAQNAAPSNRC